MDPNQQNSGQGVQQQNVPTVTGNQTDIGYQYPRIPQMQNILGPTMNTFVPGYNVMPQGQGTVIPQGQGAVMTNIQTGMPVGGFLSIGNSNGSGPLPSMGSFIASLSQPSQVGMVQNVNKSGMENWTGQPQNNNTLPSFGHFLLHQQYQQHPTNQQTLIGNQTSPQQILPSNQQSQVFSPSQHSPQFFQPSPQSQMFTTNQHSPQQVFINNQPPTHFFPNPQHSPQFFNSSIQQPQVFTGQPSSHQLFTNAQPTQQQMFNACQLQNRFPTGQIVGQDITGMPQVMATQRMNLNTNYIAGVNNILGVTAAPMLPPINQMMPSSGGQVLPSVGNVLQGQFNNMISPYSGQITTVNTSNGQMLLPNSVSTGQVAPSTNITSTPHLINVYGDRNVSTDASFVVPCCNQVTITTPTITTTVSRTTTEAVTANVHFKSSSSPKISSTIPMDTKPEKSKSQKSYSTTDSRTVIVPFGWSRVVMDNSIIYYSPSNVPLKSPMDIAKYLTTEGTCKCGLECPILINKVFNFDIGILSKMWTLDVDCPEDLTKLCNHKRKVIAMATFHSSYSLPSSTLTDTISVNSLTGGIPSTSVVTKTKADLKKKTTKVKSTKPGPYDGLLVSQLIAQRDKNKQMETEITHGSNTPDTDNMNATVTPSDSRNPVNSRPIESTNDFTSSDNLENEQCHVSLQNEMPAASVSSISISGKTHPTNSVGSGPLVNIPSSTTDNLNDQNLPHEKCRNSPFEICNENEKPQNISLNSTINFMSENMANDENKIASLNVHGTSCTEVDQKNSQEKLSGLKETETAMETAEYSQDENRSDQSETTEKMEVDSSAAINVNNEERSIESSHQPETVTSVHNQLRETTVSHSQTELATTISYLGNQTTIGHLGNQYSDVSVLTDSAAKCLSTNNQPSSSFSTDQSTKTTTTRNTDKNYESVTTTSLTCNHGNQSVTTTNVNNQISHQLATSTTVSSTISDQMKLSNTNCSSMKNPTCITCTNVTMTLHQSGTNTVATCSSYGGNKPTSNSKSEQQPPAVTHVGSMESNVSSSITKAVSNVDSVPNVKATKSEMKTENRDLRISVANTIVTSILSSINSVKGHEPGEKKQVSPKLTHKSGAKTQKSINYGCNQVTQKSTKPPSSYDSFPLYQMPQMRYPLNHGVIPPVSGAPMNPFGINPFNPGHQFMTPGIFNFPPSPYPLLNDAWLDQKKSVRKRSQKTNKKEKVKKKVNCVYDSNTPPPNVDVSQLKDQGKGPIPKVSTSVSFLDDPSAFLAEQTVLISSSLTSNLCSPTKKSDKNSPGKEDKNDTVDGDVKTSTVTSSMSNKSTKVASSVNVPTPFTFSSASHGMVVTSSTNLSKVGTAFNKHWGLPIPISESHSILGCSESEMFTEDRCESLSPDSGSECPPVNEMITPSSVVHHTANQTSTKDMKLKTESQLDKNKTQNDKILDILSNAKKKFPAISTSKKQMTVSKNIASHPVTKSFAKRSAIQQMLGSANSHEFPASTLLSAAARAQMAQQNLNFTNVVNPPSTQTPVQFGNQVKTTGIADNVTLVSADGSSFLVTQPSLAIPSSIKPQTRDKIPITQSDIVSGHESVAKLLRQPINLNVVNSLKTIDSNVGKTCSTEKSTSSTAVLNMNSKSTESVPPLVSTETVNITNNVPVVSNISSSFPPILPNLSGLPQNIGQPLLNVIGNNLGMNLLPPGQVLLPEQSGIAMSQNNVQCIPVQNEPSHANTFINVEGTNQNIQGVTSGVNLCEGLQTKGIAMTQVLTTESRPDLVQVKSSDPASTIQNMAKLPLNYDHMIQQQNVQTNNGQMLLMPNLHMPLMQFLGPNSLPVTVGLDKTGIPQLCNPTDLSMLNGQLQMGLSQTGAPLNVMNVQQQVWNNLNTGNLTAMQLQTLQLQQQLLQQIQQLQDMQSIISQFSFQGNPTTPMTTVANRDIIIAKENSITGKSTPETMVSIVSTTCQESPGNGEDGPGNSEEKGTSTDFDEDDEEGDYYNTGQEIGEVTSGDVADTTCGHSLSNVAEDDNTYVQSIQCDELDDESQSEREEGCGDTDVKYDDNLTGANNTHNRDKNVTDNVSVCHIDCSNEPVNLVSKTKHSGDNFCSLFVYTTCSNVASSSSVMSSSNNQSKITSTKQSSLKCSPEHNMSLAEKPSEASLPSDVDTIPVTTTTHSLPVNLSRQSSNIEKSLQNVYSMEVDNEVMNLSQKRYCEEDIDVTEEISESVTVVKDLHDFTIGDLVWGQIRGFPSWPGKVVHETEVYDAEELEPGKCWVKWFGDHTFTQVEMLKLKTLTEGLEGHQKSKKKNKKGRKMNSNLEAAIHEALIELDKQTTLQMDMKQKPKGKVIKKKKVK